MRYPLPREGTRLADLAAPSRTTCSGDRAKYAWLETHVCLRVPRGRPTPPTLGTHHAVADFIREAVGIGEDGAQERLFSIATDVKNRPIGVAVVAAGSIRGVVVDMHQVFQPVLLLPAYGCFLVHNHPSGDPSPSREDEVVTQKWIAAARVLDVDPIDHVILSSSGAATSLRAMYPSWWEDGPKGPFTVRLGAIAELAFGRR